MEDLQFICKSNHTHSSVLEVDRCNERRAISEVVDRMQWQVVLAHKDWQERQGVAQELRDAAARRHQAPSPPSWRERAIAAIHRRIARG